MTEGAAWLEKEAEAAARNVTRRHVDRLLALGCRKAAQLGVNHVPFGVMHVTPGKDRIYQPSEDTSGNMALIVPACWPVDEPGFNVEWRTRWPVIDLIALYLDQPSAWYWRRGTAWALGGHLLEHWQGEPLPIVATPLDWLRAGGEAVCLLDWSPKSPAWPLLRMVREVELEDDLLGKRLLDMLARTAPRPTIRRVRRPAHQELTDAA
ncbi:hypothetical protein [Novosphingobium sp.]|uniref:hypothetical protein n=1 Tax=Novosphingobium sp. TaxID=1874826 RepID=UPI00261AC093|nr:hypothetical protein [Novosphingobium sp.]